MLSQLKLVSRRALSRLPRSQLLQQRSSSMILRQCRNLHPVVCYIRSPLLAVATGAMALYIKFGRASLCQSSIKDEEVVEAAPIVEEAASATDIGDVSLQPQQACTDQVLFSCGQDIRNRPTLVARPCMHKPKNEQESLQAVESCMDTVRRAFDGLPKGEDQILVLYDMHGAGYGNFDLTFARTIIPRLISEYSDLLDKALVINGHWSVGTAWSILQRFLPPETRDKVVFCGKNCQSELQAHLSADHTYLEQLRA